MLFPHRYTRSLLLMSLLLLILGIWMLSDNASPRVEVYPVPGYDVVDGQTVSFHAIAIVVPDNMIWSRGTPWEHQSGEYIVGDATIVGYLTFKAEDPYPGTNLFDAFLQVAMADVTEDTCKLTEREGETSVIEMHEGSTVAGLPTYAASFNGAAAGTFMESSVTHLFHEGMCYEMSINIFSGNIGNYPDGSVAEFPREEVLNVFQQIIDRAIIK